MNQLLWDAGVLTLAGVHGFRKAAGDEFRRCGFRLATIHREQEPQSHIHQLSLYPLTGAHRMDRREARAVVRHVMKVIGCPVSQGDYEVAIAGRRVVASVGLPEWAWPGR